MDIFHRKTIQKYTAILTRSIDLIAMKDLIEKSKIFTNAMLEDIYSQSNFTIFFDELCTRGPKAFTAFLNVLEKANYTAEARMLMEDISQSKASYYKMDSNPLGYCKVIIIEEFDCPSEEFRKGSRVDGDLLTDTFEALGYTVLPIEWNLTGREIVSSLENFSRYLSSTNVDSCVVCILSHGKLIDNREVVCGRDYDCCDSETYVNIKEVYDVFNNENCPKMLFKPKMFFFQLCRGELQDKGHKVMKLPKNQLRNKGVNESCDSAHSVPTQYDLYPTCSDMIVVHSTLPNYKSRRNHHYGSWLCEDMKTVFTRDFMYDDLETMLKTVCQEMHKRVSAIQTKQSIHVESFGLTKIIHFGKTRIQN